MKLALLLLGTLALLYLSRDSLRAPGSHGFYRFFAWELILGLFFLNVGQWFVDPFSVVHLISWALLVLSGVLVVHAYQLLRRHGRVDRARQDVPLFEAEKTTRLVTEGAYRYVRHPLYSSLLLLAWGIFFKDPSWLGAGLALAATAFLLATASADEVESLRHFGAEYDEYMKRTRRFIPFLF